MAVSEHFKQVDYRREICDHRPQIVKHSLIAMGRQIHMVALMRPQVEDSFMQVFWQQRRCFSFSIWNDSSCERLCCQRPQQVCQEESGEDRPLQRPIDRLEITSSTHHHIVEAELE